MSLVNPSPYGSLIPQRGYQNSSLTERVFEHEILLAIVETAIDVRRNKTWLNSLVPEEKLTKEVLRNPYIEHNFHLIEVGPSFNTAKQAPISVFDNLKVKKIPIRSSESQIRVARQALFTDEGVAIFNIMLTRMIDNLAAIEEYVAIKVIAAAAKSIHASLKPESMVSAIDRINRYYDYTNFIFKVNPDPNDPKFNPFIKLTKNILNIVENTGVFFKVPTSICETATVRDALSNELFYLGGKPVEQVDANQPQTNSGLMMKNGSTSVIGCNVGLSNVTSEVENPLHGPEQYGSYVIAPSGKIEIYDTVNDCWAEIEPRFDLTGLFDDKGFLSAGENNLMCGYKNTDEKGIITYTPKIFIGEMAHPKYDPSIKPDFLINAAKLITKSMENIKGYENFTTAIFEGVNLMNKLNNPSEKELFETVFNVLLKGKAEKTMTVANQEHGYVRSELTYVKPKDATSMLPKGTAPFGFGSVVGFRAIKSSGNSPFRSKTELDKVEKFLHVYDKILSELRAGISQSWFNDPEIVHGFLTKEWLDHFPIQAVNQDRPNFLAFNYNTFLTNADAVTGANYLEKLGFVPTFIKTGGLTLEAVTINDVKYDAAAIKIIFKDFLTAEPSKTTFSSKIYKEVDFSKAVVEWLKLAIARKATGTDPSSTCFNVDVDGKLGGRAYNDLLAENQEKLLRKFLFDTVAVIPLIGTKATTTINAMAAIIGADDTTGLRKQIKELNIEAATPNKKETAVQKLLQLLQTEYLPRLNEQFNTLGLENNQVVKLKNSAKLIFEKFLNEFKGVESIVDVPSGDKPSAWIILPITVSKNMTFDPLSPFAMTDDLFPARIQSKKNPSAEGIFIEGDIYSSVFETSGMDIERRDDFMHKEHKDEPIGLPDNMAGNFAKLMEVFNLNKSWYNKANMAERLAYAMYSFGYCTAKNFASMYKASIVTPLMLTIIRPHITVIGAHMLSFGQEERIATKYTTEDYIDEVREGDDILYYINRKYLIRESNRVYMTPNPILIKPVEGEGTTPYDPKQMDIDKNYYNPNQGCYGAESQDVMPETKSIMYWVWDPISYEKFKEKKFANTITITGDFNYLREKVKILVPQEDSNYAKNLPMFEKFKEIWHTERIDVKEPTSKGFVVNTVLRVGTAKFNGTVYTGNDFNTKQLASGKDGLNKYRFIGCQ